MKRLIVCVFALACNNIEGTWNATSYNGSTFPAEDCDGSFCINIESVSMKVEQNDAGEQVGEFRSRVAILGFSSVVEYPIVANQNDDGNWELLLELGGDSTYSADWVCDVNGRSMSCETDASILFEKE